MGDLTITSGNQTISGWIEFSVTCGIEVFPRSFDISLTERTPDSQVISLGDGEPCTVELDGTTIVSGFIDSYGAEIEPSRHSVRVNGRGKGEDLHDCSAVITSGQMAGGDLLSIAQKLAQPFGVTVTSTTKAKLPQVPLFTVNLGETPFEIIDRLAKFCGVLFYETADGNAVIADVGTTKAASGVTLRSDDPSANNVQRAAIKFDSASRYTDYMVVWQSVDTLSDTAPGTNLHGESKDTVLLAQGRFRPKYIVSQQTTGGQDLGQKTADWQKNRNYGRSRALTVTVDSWTDSGGTLWTPNTLVDCNLPNLKVTGVTWLISEVTYRKTAEGGTTADLTIMPPEAFSVEPLALNNGLADIIPNLGSPGGNSNATADTSGTGSGTGSNSNAGGGFSSLEST